MMSINTMYTKPDLRVLFNVQIIRSGSVIVTVIRLRQFRPKIPKTLEVLNPARFWYNDIMDTSNLQNLPPNQKIELVFQLWDQIADSGTPIVLSESVKQEIDRRCSELDANPGIAIDEAEMWRRVNES